MRSVSNWHTRTVRWLAVGAGLALPAATTAQPASESAETQAFIERARAGTEPFQDLENAIAAGYRKIGPDTPDMGEHWVHISLAMDGRLVAERPPVLTYLRIEGKPQLTGVAYALPVSAGAEMPPSPVPDARWHDHSGTVDEELLGGAAGAADGPRLAMIHAWIWLDNPDGTFAAENWALPYVRLGLDPPLETSRPAACALFLATDGGATYYLARLRSVVELDHDEASAALGAFTSAAERVRLLLEPHASAGLTAGLERIWDELGHALTQQYGPEVWSRLSPANEHHAH